MGQVKILESGLWFGPFLRENVFLLESHSQQKGMFSKGSIPKMAEFAWSDLNGRRPKVWIVEAKMSIANQQDPVRFDENLKEWSIKLANAITMIAGIKAGAFRPDADLSDVPAYLQERALRDLQFFLVVVLNAGWCTDTHCQAIQIELRKKLAEPLRAWGMPRDSVYVYNRDMAQIMRLTTGEVDL
jgi:hypothetical protein